MTYRKPQQDADAVVEKLSEIDFFAFFPQTVPQQDNLPNRRVRPGGGEIASRRFVEASRTSDKRTGR